MSVQSIRDQLRSDGRCKRRRWAKWADSERERPQCPSQVRAFIKFTLWYERKTRRMAAAGELPDYAVNVPVIADLNEGRDALAAAHDAHLEALDERRHQLEDWIDGGAL